MAEPEATRRLGDWFRRWRLPLQKFLITKPSVTAGDVDDISQEVFLRLLRYERTELVQHPQAYLFQIASNVASEWAIRARSRYPHKSSWVTELVAEDSPEEEASRERISAEVERAINTLPMQHRSVLRLRFTEDLGYAEIAERLGISRRRVKRTIVNSYAKLRSQLAPE